MALVVKELRADTGLSQIEVYGNTNIHIGRIESAKANPTVSTISALCEYFQISQSEFYKRVEAVK